MFRFIVIISLFLNLSILYANEIVTLNPKSEELKIGKQVYYFEDRESNQTIENVSKDSFENNFRLNQNDQISFSYSPYTYWIRFDIENLNQLIMEWFLEIGYSHLDSIEFYYLEDSIWLKKEYGDTIPFFNREIFSRFFVIPIKPNANQVTRYFIRLKSSTVVLAPLSIYSPKNFFIKNSTHEIWYALFYGAMSIMIVYNAFIYFAFRNVSYLLYCFSTFSLLFFYIAFNGHGFQYLWSESIWWQNHAVPILTAIGWASMLPFTDKFLELKKNFIRLRKIGIILQVLFLLSLLLLGVSIRLCVTTQNFLGIICVTFVFSAGIKSLLSGNKAARYFVFAWVTFLVGIILTILNLTNLIDRNFFTSQTMQIGSILELILLSLALSDRYKIIQDENIRVQAELLDSERKVKETLEIKVKERTAELDLSLKLIRDDLYMAQKIQSATLSSNLKQTDNLEYLVKYIPMNEVGGDFYSIDKLDESVYRVFLADATGHGVQAALIMMAIQGIYDSIKNFSLPTNEILEIFNKEFIRRYGTINSFLTCIIVDIDCNQEKIFYSSAGHPAGVLLKKESDMVLLPNTGGLIGIDGKNKYRQVEIPFLLNEMLFLFTDGIFEQHKEEVEFGEQNLYTIMKNQANNNISETIENALKALKDFLGDTDAQDDITIIGISLK